MANVPLEIKVYGYHIDVNNHVNNGRYLEFLEAARWHYYEPHFGKDLLKNRGFAMIILQMDLKYRYSAKLGDNLQIFTQLDELKSRAVCLSQKIYLKNKNKLILEAFVTFGIMDIAKERLVSIPIDLYKELEKIA